MNNNEIFYNNYVETCNIAKINEEKRDKLFINICIVLGILFLFSYESNSILQLINSWMLNTFNCNIVFSTNIIQIVAWIILLIISLKYFSLNINIDRCYDYIHSMENKLNKITHNTFFSREGNSYLKKYPLTLNFAYYLYKIVFPIIYIFVVSIKLAIDFTNNFNFMQIILAIICDALASIYLFENLMYIINDLKKK